MIYPDGDGQLSFGKLDSALQSGVFLLFSVSRGTQIFLSYLPLSRCSKRLLLPIFYCKHFIYRTEEISVMVSDEWSVLGEDHHKRRDFLMGAMDYPFGLDFRVPKVRTSNE